MKYIIGIALLIVLLTLPAQARDESSEEFTGLELLRGCTAAIKQFDGRAISPKENIEMTYWMGFLAGFMDGNILTRLKGEKWPLCLPSTGIATEQAVRIVHKYLENHLEGLHQSGRILIFLALREAFPCKE